jgi:hypothetical protein
MDGSFGRDLDLRGLVWFALIGMVAAVIVVLGGAGWLIWWAIHHIAIV